MEQCLRARYIVQMKILKDFAVMAPGKVEGSEPCATFYNDYDWIVPGVLTSISPVKQATSGNSYISIRIHDLALCSVAAVIFSPEEAALTSLHAQVQMGQIVYLLNPEFLFSKEVRVTFEMDFLFSVPSTYCDPYLDSARREGSFSS